MFGVACVFASVAMAASQPSAEDERRDAIRLLRAINTAENAIAARSTGHNYVSMPELVAHPSMGGMKGDITIGATAVAYKGLQIRLALSSDATQYVVTVVSPTGVAAFTDERGVIYTGESLK
jgi:hypothetical protein